MELLESGEVRAAVAAALGTSVGRMRTIDAFVPADARLVGVRVSGRSGRRVQRMAELAVDAASRIQHDRTGVEAQVVPGGLRERGLKPLETGLAAAVGGLVLAMCAGFAMIYFNDQEAERDQARRSQAFSAGSSPPVGLTPPVEDEAGGHAWHAATEQATAHPPGSSTSAPATSGAARRAAGSISWQAIPEAEHHVVVGGDSWPGLVRGQRPRRLGSRWSRGWYGG